MPPDDGPVDPNAPLPPELDPRGRRHAKQARREAAAAAPPEAPSPWAERFGPPPPRVGVPPRTGGPRRDLRVGLKLGLMTVLTLVSLLVLGVSAYAWVTYRAFDHKITRIDAVPGGGTDIDGKDQNILIAGNDNRDTATDAELQELSTGRDGGSLNTDTIMLIHVPADGRRATVISIPRDSYVAIPGYGSDKINSAYPDGYNDTKGNTTAKLGGGAKLLVQTVQDLTGLKIDHFAEVDLLGFFRISKAIGGVPINLCAAQNEPKSGIDLPAGPQEIEGKQALAFVRQRYGLPNGDLDRIHRQQYFLSQAFRKLTTAGVLLNPTKLTDLTNAVSLSLQMDPGLHPLDLAKQMATLTADNINFQTIKNQGIGDNDAGSVIFVDPDIAKQWVREVIAGPITTTPVAPSKAGVIDVLNGSGVSGAAGSNAKALQTAGFTVGQIDNTDATTTTAVRYPVSKAAGAAAVAKLIPGVSVVEDDSVQNITLILGSDGKSVGGAAPTTTAPAPTTTAPAPTPVPVTECVN